MLNSIFELSANTTVTLTASAVIICTIASLLLGVLAACIYMYKNSYTKNFVLTLALLPAMVQIVIMLVNGNLGTGIAVLGAFGPFASAPSPAQRAKSAVSFLQWQSGLQPEWAISAMPFCFCL